MENQYGRIITEDPDRNDTNSVEVLDRNCGEIKNFFSGRSVIEVMKAVEEATAADLTCP